MKKIIALLIAIAMLGCILVACGNDGGSPTETGENPPASDATGSSEPTDSVNIWDGYYSVSFGGAHLSYIHFNEDGTYYGSYFGGSVLEAGTWELVDEPTTYAVDDNGDGMGKVDEGESTAESTQTIIMTNYATGTPVRVAYVDDTLMDISLGGMANNRYMKHDAEYAYDPEKDEVPIQLYVYYANNDIGSTFILNHNKTFEDVTGDVYDSGTWEMTGAGEYTLTYEFGGSAVLAVNGKSATLTKNDGTVIELKDDYKEDVAGAVVLTMSAENVEIGLGYPGTLRLECYEDMTCSLIIDLYGNVVPLDSGTYEISAGYTLTVHLTTLGDVVGVTDYAGVNDAGLPMTLTINGTIPGESSDMVIDATIAGSYLPAQ